MHTEPIRHGNRNRSAVALTFDDGPGPDTLRVLDALAAIQVPATFFLVGSRVAEQEETVARIAAAGHEIGSHSWAHGRTDNSLPAVFRGLVRTSAAIGRATGSRPRWFRPPYSNWTRGLVRAAWIAGMQTVLWDSDPRDWEADDSADVVERVLRSTRSGSIVVLHESGTATVRALPSIVENLKVQGLDLVTVGELLARR